MIIIVEYTDNLNHLDGKIYKWISWNDNEYYINIFINEKHLRYNNTAVKTPIDIPKEDPLVLVILTVRHCEEKCVADNLHVWWFWTKRV